MHVVADIIFPGTPSPNTSGALGAAEIIEMLLTEKAFVVSVSVVDARHVTRFVLPSPSWRLGVTFLFLREQRRSRAGRMEQDLGISPGSPPPSPSQRAAGCQSADVSPAAFDSAPFLECLSHGNAASVWF